MAQHDAGYKNLFSHPELVRDLLQGYVHQPWVNGLAWETLERVDGSYTSEDLRAREDDMIWRIRHREGWIYIYLLLEFQSQNDPGMAVRIMTYLGLLYQDLLKDPGALQEGKLPPVLPLVLYNGEGRWQAPVEIADLILPAPPGLESYRPRLSYLLIDEGRLGTVPGPERNLASALFRLENSRSPETLREVIHGLAGWLQAPEQASLRRAFTVWLKRVLLPGRLPGIHLPEINELQEVETMLAERVKEWTHQWMQQGMQQGIQRGMQQGESKVLQRQLIRRFGPLPPWARERLEGASEAELEHWADNILDAKGLDEVFRD